MDRVATSKKRNYDWSSFLNSGDSGGDDSEDGNMGASSSSLSSLSTPPKTKKKKAALAVRRMEWIEQLIPMPAQLSLMEKSAEALAKTYSDNETLLPELSNMEKSDIAGFFKIQVGAFLKGVHLAQMIDNEKGLAKLERNSCDQLFQKFLINLIHERDRLDQPPPIATRLTNCLRAYKILVDRSLDVQHNVHRLGLTKAFKQDNLITRLDFLMSDYYTHLDDRTPYVTGSLPVVYPLPHVLRIDPVATYDKRSRCFPLGELTLKRMAEMYATCESPSERMAEFKGLELSHYSEEKRHERLKNMARDRTVGSRHLTMLTSMVRAQFNGAPQLVLITALMALVEPFYSASRASLEDASNAPLLRRFRFDIFWFLSCALSTFYACLDLPLACYAMAKKSLPRFVCVGDEMRLAIMYQNILVMYGHWKPARHLFQQWFFRMPVSSWMFEELVLVHVKGVFRSIEELFVEIYITNMIHGHCGRLCDEMYIDKAYKTIDRRVSEVQRMAFQVLAKVHVQFRFQSELQLIVQLCSYYKIMLKKMERDNENTYANELKHIWQKMQWERSSTTSQHIQPFVRQLPYGIDSTYYWTILINDTVNHNRRQWETAGLLSTSLSLADALFSLIGCMLHNKRTSFSLPDLITKAIDQYERFTNCRHYRIPLLKKLQLVVNDPSNVALPPNDSIVLPYHFRRSVSHIVGCEHPGVPQEKLTAVGMSQEEIKRFSRTAKDSLNNFASLEEWSNDDMFVAYLRQRDEMMPVWMDVGLTSFRYAEHM